MPLLDTLMIEFTPQLLGSLAGKLGESPDSIQKGLKAELATILGSIGNRSSDSGFLQQIVGTASSPANDPSVLTDPGELATGNVPQAISDLTSQFLSTVFGSTDKQAAVCSLVGQAAGLKASSAAKLMNMAAAMVMGILGKQATSSMGLGSMLTAELPGLSRYMPAGLSSILAGPSVPHGASSHAQVEPLSGGGGWVLPALIGLLILGGLFWYFLKGQEAGKEIAATKPRESAEPTETAKGRWPALGEFFKRRLPDGVELNIPKSGVENKLIDYIESSNPVDKETWFDFDRVLFDTGKATLQPESQAQLKDVASILKAYPMVHVRLGGYTDNAGDKAANLTLSQARANAVMGELVMLGIEPSRLDAKGYGDEHPVAPNDSEEGRAKNRRLSMRVTAK